jgi:hypothetical protein
MLLGNEIKENDMSWTISTDAENEKYTRILVVKPERRTGVGEIECPYPFDQFSAHYMNRFRMLRDSVPKLRAEFLMAVYRKLVMVIRLHSVANPESEAISCGSTNRTPFCLPPLCKLIRKYTNFRTSS